MSSAAQSPTRPPSIFDDVDYTAASHEGVLTDPMSGSPGDQSYDLKPPLSDVEREDAEDLATRLWSGNHLDMILCNPGLASQLRRFVQQYRPQHITTLTRYSEFRKALAAIEYANSVAIHSSLLQGQDPCLAANISERFIYKSRPFADELLENVLPAFLTYRFVSSITDTLVREITGRSMPFMKELIPGLAEVFCLSDPSQPDNPIVYASEEFFRTTQFGRDHVIGRNCRFLQGPQTSLATVNRLAGAIRSGVDACEIILNYKRDGTPFLNLLMMAPLYDNKGQVRYFLGCQVDITHLVEGGKGMESLHELLNQDRRSIDSLGTTRIQETSPAIALTHFGGMLSDDDAERIHHRRQTAVGSSGGDGTGDGAQSRGPRRIFGVDEERDRPMWSHATLGASGRLPGIYQNYLLVRPFPSLRITFTSPALRIPGLLQTKFLDHIGGDEALRDGIRDAMAQGVAVTARVAWLPTSATDEAANRRFEGAPRTRWVHCTPLVGIDNRVGVWMVVMVEDERVTGRLNTRSEPVMVDHRKKPSRISHSSASQILNLEPLISPPSSISSSWTRYDTASKVPLRPVSRGRPLTRSSRSSMKDSIHRPVSRTDQNGMCSGMPSSRPVSPLQEEEEFRILEKR